MKKNNGYVRNDENVLDSLVNALQDKNEKLENELNRLRINYNNSTVDNIALTEDNNDLKDDRDNLRALMRLQTLVLIIMGIMQPYCFENSEIGRVIGKNIQKYYKDCLTSLPNYNFPVTNELMNEYEEDSEDEQPILG